jgi:hypothetical protein
MVLVLVLVLVLVAADSGQLLSVLLLFNLGDCDEMGLTQQFIGSNHHLQHTTHNSYGVAQ